MKNSILIALTAVIGVQAGAQSLHWPLSPSHRKIASIPPKPKILDKSTQSYFIDYEAYDYFLNGNDDNKIQRSISDVLYDRTDSFNLTQAYVAFDSLILTTDYTDFLPYSSTDFTSITVDTVYIALWHGKTSSSSLADTLVVTLHPAQGGRPVESTIYATQVLELYNSLSQPPTANGYPLDVVPFAFNYTLPANANNSFAVRFRFRSFPGDTVYVLYSWPSTGNQCGSFTGVKDIVVASVYPNSFYRVYLAGQSNTPNNLFPRTTGLYVWYLDCDGSGDPYIGGNVNNWNQAENIFQHWAIWARITATASTSVPDLDASGVHFAIQPNPASEESLLRLQLARGGAYTFTIRDITGKAVLTHNLGALPPGEVHVPLKVSSLSQGLYTCTLEGNGYVHTQRFVKK